MSVSLSPILSRNSSVIIAGFSFSPFHNGCEQKRKEKKSKRASYMIIVAAFGFQELYLCIYRSSTINEGKINPTENDHRFIDKKRQSTKQCVGLGIDQWFDIFFENFET